MTDEQNERAARVWREAMSAYAAEQEVIDGVVHLNMNKRNQAATAVIAREFEALEAENARLREALVQHNDRLRSAAQVAARDGQDTNWKTFRGQITYTLAEYHDLVIAARAALGASHDADA